MTSISSILCVVVCLLLACDSVQSIRCRKCFPPLPEDECKRSDDTIECRDFEELGYDSCIQVEYNGNHTVARTCYRSFMCKEAKEWCKIRGPCTVKCCGHDLCNGSYVVQSAIKLLILPVLAALGLIAML